MSKIELIQGDCLVAMKDIPDNSVDAIVTDPPYGLRFMGKKWDKGVPGVEFWQEMLRVLKPGGYLLSFGGTRTYHRMACAIEDAGFQIRDMIEWVYGSGFPKSHSIGKAVDKAAGVEREVVGVAGKSGSKRSAMAGDFKGGEYDATAPATDEAKQWEGWGTATKPAHEPIIICTKPLTLENIYGILSLEITENLRRQICQKSNVSAEDVEKNLKSILLKLEKAGVNTVTEDVKTYVLENTESVSIAAVSSISHRRILKEQTEGYKEGFVQDDAKANGNEGLQEKTAPTGKMEHLLEPMAMLQLMSEDTTTGLSMLSSWKNILEGILSGAKRTSTIETVLKTITELKTLNCYLSASTLEFTSPNLKFAPNLSPICMARKPLSEKTIAANVLKWGTGGINIDASRVGLDGEAPPTGSAKRVYAKNQYTEDKVYGDNKETSPLGRFPANLILDGSQQVLDLFPKMKGAHGGKGDFKQHTWMGNGKSTEQNIKQDSGSAARFFYCAKASKKDRDEGCDAKNNHPTVKPTALMQYLCRLITPPGGTVLDPFMGSGSTGKAAVKEGFRFIGIERDLGYFEIAEKRIGETPDDLFANFDEGEQT